MTVSQWLEHYLVVIMTVVFVGIVVCHLLARPQDEDRAAGAHSVRG